MLPKACSNQYLSVSDHVDITTKLFAHWSFMRVYKRAYKTNQVLLHMTGVEKWNWPGEDGKTSEVPNPDGHFSVEGHTWEDVEGVWYLNPFSLADWVLWFEFFFRLIKESFKDGWIRNRKRKGDFLRSIRNVAWWIWRMAPHDLTFKRYNWIWVVESFSVIRNDLAEEALDAKYKITNIPPGQYKERLDKEYAAVTPDQILEYLKANAYQISNAMWVSKSDPTVIMVNEQIVLYDMKDGWSDKKVASIIRQWFYLLFSLKVQEKLVGRS